MTSRGAHASAAAGSGWQRKLGGLLRLSVPARLRSVRHRWLVIVPAVAGVAAVSAVLAYVLASGSQPAHPRPVAYDSPNPDTTEPMPQFHVPAKVAPVVLPSTGAIRLPIAEQPQARTWKAGSGGAALTAVSSQAGDVAQASGLKEYVEMKQSCSKLAASVSQAQVAPPVPDAALQAKYSKALSELAQAAANCQAGISEQPEGDEYVATTENQADLSASATSLAAGSKDLYQATGGISALGQGS